MLDNSPSGAHYTAEKERAEVDVGVPYLPVSHERFKSEPAVRTARAQAVAKVREVMHTCSDKVMDG